MNSLYGLDRDDELVLFPAYIDAYLPYQQSICRSVLEILRSRPRPAKLLVRVRPGFDEENWMRFQQDNSDDVRLQIPQSSGFDKSGKVRSFDVRIEARDVGLFAATIRRAAAVVTPCFSTVETDAMLLGKPVVNAIFNPDDATVQHPSLAWYRAGALRNPAWSGAKVATSMRDLRAMLEDALERGTTKAEEDRLFEARDGLAGMRAVAAVRRFMTETMQSRSALESQSHPIVRTVSVSPE